MGHAATRYPRSTTGSRRGKSLNALFLRIFLSRNMNLDNGHQSHYSVYFVHTAVLDGDMCIPCAVNLFQMNNMQIITYFPIKKLTDQGAQDVDAHVYLFYYAHEDHLQAARYECIHTHRSRIVLRINMTRKFPRGWIDT